MKFINNIKKGEGTWYMGEKIKNTTKEFSKEWLLSSKIWKEKKKEWDKFTDNIQNRPFTKVELNIDKFE